ncbi:hypothetical protein F0562_009953 [Nyssa sinensis]|uniref:WW domain-containing protein n=1 Tax=Nyssa sinensis TaxID=561372 RepID=A0A5J4ZZ60_9ASTE|nr:hypothetical protein F0562_009953 [Nyssa sinensis]
MGKRKERRLAAMSGTGRRVKLDLLAEPSGDLGGSSAQDEVGGDIDLKHRAGLPNSPSSSGQQPDNPLMLLGQYSDDELDEELSKKLDHAIAEDDSADLRGQVDGGAGEDVEINADEDIGARKVEQHDMETAYAYLEALQTQVDNDAREIDPTGSGDSIKEMDSMGQMPVPELSDIQVAGDASSGWKIVLHEESNRYYYWNTVTGETSWEVPDVLAKGAELTREQKSAPDAKGRESAVVGKHESGSLDAELDDSITTKTVDGSEAANVIYETEKNHEHGPRLDVWNEGYPCEISEDKKGGSDANENDSKNSSGTINAPCNETSSHEDHIFPRQSGDILLGNGSARDSYSEKYTHNITAHDGHETGTDLSSHLVKHGECLLERLSLLKGSKGHLQGDEQISKYILEVEIRLSDIKSLLSYGSSLFPFWVHSERQLKKLESEINDEFSQFYKSAQTNEVEATNNSLESMGDDIKADGYEKKVVCSTSENPHTSVNVGVITEVQKDSHNEVSCNYANNAEHLSTIGYTTTHSGSGGGKEEVHGAASAAEITPKTLLHSGEDVDMDVDMEVEDAVPASSTTMALDATNSAPPEQPIQSNLPAEYESIVPDEGFGVPPPPDEDWIPPPPPDNELVPPPPPDEPPEPLYPPPPPYLETVQPLSYTELHNLSYAGHNFEYYGHINAGVPGSNFFGHAEGCQVAVPHPPLYYEVVPNIYPGADPVVVNPVEPVAYYDLQNGIVAPVPVISGVESSGIHSPSGNETLGSGIRSIEALTEASCTSVPNTELDDSAVGEETEKASREVEVPFTPATIQAPVTTSIIESVPVSTAAITVAAVAATSTVATVQSKVSRSKKRTVAVAHTLRSNKKVSSLVDKWKAAKEEMHEAEEDEPENAYENLEKKRKREIEEWHAQQIASGEAKDNANFQPLGGDWRKRVKRRRAQSASEAVQTPSDDLTDLNKLSRDLPSGWQAYWDEASKQVYYGNSVTSETTWIRPTN